MKLTNNYQLLLLSLRRIILNINKSKDLKNKDLKNKDLQNKLYIKNT